MAIRFWFLPYVDPSQRIVVIYARLEHAWQTRWWRQSESGQHESCSHVKPNLRACSPGRPSDRLSRCVPGSTPASPYRYRVGCLRFYLESNSHKDMVNVGDTNEHGGIVICFMPSDLFSFKEIVSLPRALFISYSWLVNHMLRNTCKTGRGGVKINNLTR